MNDKRDTSIELMLVDYHLGQLDEEQVRTVEAAIASSPELAARGKALADTLRPLDSWQPDSPPANLTERILDRVAAQSAQAPAHGVPAETLIPFPSSEQRWARPFVSIRELVAIAACITIFVGVFLPGYYRYRTIAQRIACADNMRQLAGAVGMYSQAHAGALPFAGAVRQASWLPVRTPGVRVVSNRRHPYLLMKLGYIRDPKTYVCPSRENDFPMMASQYENFSDFPEPNNISYAYQNMNGGPLRATGATARLVILSDQNPLFDGGRFHPASPSMTNSRTHGDGEGQNVARADGSVQWATTPTVGIQDDDIFRAGKITQYTGTEVPQSEADSFLIP